MLDGMSRRILTGSFYACDAFLQSNVMGDGGIDHDYRSKRDYGYTAQRLYAVAIPSATVRLLFGIGLLQVS